MIGLEENFKHEKYVYIIYCVYYIYIYIDVTLRIIDIDKDILKPQVSSTIANHSFRSRDVLQTPSHVPTPRRRARCRYIESR